MKRTSRIALALLSGVSIAAASVGAKAEGSIRIARQFGISYLILDVCATRI